MGLMRDGVVKERLLLKLANEYNLVRNCIFVVCAGRSENLIIPLYSRSQPVGSMASNALPPKMGPKVGRNAIFTVAAAAELTLKAYSIQSIEAGAAEGTFDGTKIYSHF